MEKESLRRIQQTEKMVVFLKIKRYERGLKTIPFHKDTVSVSELLESLFKISDTYYYDLELIIVFKSYISVSYPK